MAINASQSGAPELSAQPGRATMPLLNPTSPSLTKQACKAGAVQALNGSPTFVAPSTASITVLPYAGPGGQPTSSSSPPPPSIAPNTTGTRTRTRTSGTQKENERPAKKAKGTRNVRISILVYTSDSLTDLRTRHRPRKRRVKCRAIHAGSG